MELGSNGKEVRYADRRGKTYVPAQHYEELILHDSAFQFSSWGAARLETTSSTGLAETVIVIYFRRDDEGRWLIEEM